MTIYTCDKCLKEIPTGENVGVIITTHDATTAYYTGLGTSSRKNDLCKTCALELQTWFSQHPPQQIFAAEP